MCHPKVRVIEVEVCVAEILKHSPNQKGGGNYKVIILLSLKF